MTAAQPTRPLEIPAEYASEFRVFMQASFPDWMSTKGPSVYSPWIDALVEASVLTPETELSLDGVVRWVSITSRTVFELTTRRGHNRYHLIFLKLLP